MELETAKEILAGVFRAQPGEVKETIKRRLEESSMPAEREEGQWLPTFCMARASLASSRASFWRAWRRSPTKVR